MSYATQGEELSNSSLTKPTPSIALVGGGFFGQLLADAFMQSGARIAAIVDRNLEAIGPLAERTGAQTFSNVTDLFKATTIDLAVIATPNHVHVEPALAAIEAGCPTFVEKPLALSGDDCDAMLSAAQRRGIPLFVGHVLRTLPGVMHVKALIEEGALGTIVAARATRQRWLVPKSPNADWWKLDRSKSGGELMHELHELDLLCWLLGDVKDVFARAGNRAHPLNPDADDVIQLSLGLASGALVNYEIGTAYHRTDWGVVIHGDLMSVHIDFVDSVVRHHNADGSIVCTPLFDDVEADTSLQQFNKLTQNYNVAGSKPSRWMSKAVEIEAASVIQHITGGPRSPLASTQADAVKVVLRANTSIIENR